MDAWTFTLLVVGTATVCLSGSVNADCPGVNTCVKQELFNQLSTTNPTNYCEQGAVIAGQAVRCLEDCLAAGTSSFLNDQIEKINSFCKAASPNCNDVVGTYVNQTKCFDKQDGGLDLITSQIIEYYKAGKSKEQAKQRRCNDLFGGVTCQKKRDCKYNADLYFPLVTSDPRIPLCLSLCGSEELPKLAPYLVKTDKCSEALFTRIETECNISMSLCAAATTNEEACSLLETQAACIEKLTVGCTTATQRYLLPRMDSFTLANEILGCKVSINGIELQARSDCNYTAVINQCFYANAVDNAMKYRILPLLCRDLPVGGFCQNSQNKDAQLLNCKMEILSCTVPQARLLVVPNKYDDSYAPTMGTFPINIWGMNSIFTWLNGDCKPNQTWSDRIYVPPVQAQPTKKTTPPPKNTPEPAARNPTPSTRAENELGNLQGNFKTTSGDL